VVETITVGKKLIPNRFVCYPAISSEILAKAEERITANMNNPEMQSQGDLQRVCPRCLAPGHSPVRCTASSPAPQAQGPPVCFICHAGRHWVVSCPQYSTWIQRSPGGSSSRQLFPVGCCFKCGSPDHWARACPSVTGMFGTSARNLPTGMPQTTPTVTPLQHSSGGSQSTSQYGPTGVPQTSSTGTPQYGLYGGPMQNLQSMDVDTTIPPFKPNLEATSLPVQRSCCAFCGNQDHVTARCPIKTRWASQLGDFYSSQKTFNKAIEGWASAASVDIKELQGKMSTLDRVSDSVVGIESYLQKKDSSFQMSSLHPVPDVPQQGPSFRIDNFVPPAIAPTSNPEASNIFSTLSSSMSASVASTQSLSAQSALPVSIIPSQSSTPQMSQSLSSQPIDTQPSQSTTQSSPSQTPVCQPLQPMSTDESHNMTSNDGRGKKRLREDAIDTDNMENDDDSMEGQITGESFVPWTIHTLKGKFVNKNSLMFGHLIKYLNTRALSEQWPEGCSFGTQTPWETLTTVINKYKLPASYFQE
jgi:hypothetical protein